jgi:hypothetical protein
MKPTKTAGPRGSLTYGTSDDEVFYDAVRQKKQSLFILIIFSLYKDSTYYTLSTTNSTNS